MPWKKIDIDAEAKKEYDSSPEVKKLWHEGRKDYRHKRITLYELIKQVSDIITPDGIDFYNYVLHTSDDNGGFLRTRHCWWDKSLEDKKLHGEYKKVLVTCNKKISVGDLVNKKDTKLKLQFHYDYFDASFEDADWDRLSGYCYIYLIDCDTRTFVMEYGDALF